MVVVLVMMMVMVMMGGGGDYIDLRSKVRLRMNSRSDTFCT